MFGPMNIDLVIDLCASANLLTLFSKLHWYVKVMTENNTTEFLFHCGLLTHGAEAWLFCKFESVVDTNAYVQD